MNVRSSVDAGLFWKFTRDLEMCSAAHKDRNDR